MNLFLPSICNIPWHLLSSLYRCSNFRICFLDLYLKGYGDDDWLELIHDVI